MSISQKSQYALRALFELASRHGGEPVRVTDIASAQAIPPRFLEVILCELKQGGFVQSRRGARGGYMLAQPPRKITVGDVIAFVQGPVAPVPCLSDSGDGTHQPDGHRVFMPMWIAVQKAVTDIYYGTTFEDLLERHMHQARRSVPNYVI